jgi:hypothetical protein
MMRRGNRTLFSVAVVALLSLSSALRAQEDLNENEKELLSVVEPLQQGVQRDDRAAVAKLLVYPLEVWNGNARVTIKTPAAFLGQYEKIVDFRLKRTIVRADVRKAFSNYQGSMFDRGRIWIGMRGESFGVVTINQPAMHDYNDSIPFDTDDTLNFRDLIAEYLGQSDNHEQLFLFTAADGNARVAIPEGEKETIFTVGATRYRLSLVASSGGAIADHLILSPLGRHRGVAKE